VSLRNRRQTLFLGANTGPWEITRLEAVAGPSLEPVACLRIREGGELPPAGTTPWVLRGVASYDRYVTRSERTALEAVQPPLGRPEASRAALIPIAKSAAWWELSHDERRAIFETRSQHIATGLQYLPAIARRLYQSRDLGEPFDFLTWFEYAPTDASGFEELVKRLRGSEEWRFVEREVDIRLRRVAV